MAGAGYKLFNTGDVLTAAQVNTYLQEQTVMVFADAAARTTALSGVLSEGMITYLKDTNAVEKYTGSAWVNIDTGSTSPLTTKGDLYTYSTTDTRLAVGNNGETLVADSSATTGLRWQGNFAAGKNKIINGDFGIWQRGTSFSGGTGYSADRWRYETGGGNWFTISQQALPANTLNGLTAQYFLQNVVSANSGSGDYGIFSQRIEDVRTFAGQTVTVSFWAKSASGTPKLGLEFYQVTNGTGGGSIPVSAITISTTWTRYTATVAIPSLSGATIAAGNFLEFTFWMTAGSSWNSRASSIGNQANTFSIAGVQVEVGNTATAFQTATGTLQGELAACQRYYWRYGGESVFHYFAQGVIFSATIAYANVYHPVKMRVAPTSIDFSTLAIFDGGTNLTVTNVTMNQAASNMSSLTCTISGGTQYRPAQLTSNNSTSGYLGLNAEL